MKIKIDTSSLRLITSWLWNYICICIYTYKK